MKKSGRYAGYATSRAGFTLVEVMLVVVIIAILASVAVVSTKGKSKRASINATRATIKSVQTALAMYENDTGTYPSSLKGLKEDVDGIGAAWAGPYLTGNSEDAWGNPLQYDSAVGPASIKSWGPNRQSGGGDDVEGAQ